MNKRGQFYLIAAIIIIGILLGFTTISNDVKKGSLDKSKLYKLFIDTNIEDSKMINYPDNLGIKGYNDESLKKIFESFTNAYPEINEIYFVVWDEKIEKKYEYIDGEIKGNWSGGGYFFEPRKNYYIMIVKEENEQYTVHG